MHLIPLLRDVPLEVMQSPLFGHSSVDEGSEVMPSLQPGHSHWE
jgi:hypothetical protein